MTIEEDYNDKWMTVYDTEKHSFLPVSHRFIFDMQLQNVEAECAVVLDNFEWSIWIDNSGYYGVKKSVVYLIYNAP